MENKNTKKKKRNAILALVVALCLIAGFGFGMHLLEQRGSAEDEQIGDTGEWGDEGIETHIYLGDHDFHYTDDIETYLLVGTDAGTVTEKTRKGFDGEMADFLLLVVINNTTQKYAFIQLDRDTITEVQVLDENGETTGAVKEQLCTAHWYGQNADQRNANTVTAVSDLFGYLPINGYFVLNMKDISTINHAIGGVVIDFNQDLTAIDPAFKEGESVLLSDKQAEEFVRARMSVGDGTNVERMARQRQYMEAVYSLLVGQLRENPAYLDDLYEELHKNIESDQSAKTVSTIANKISQYESLGILRIEGESREADTLDDGELHAEFLMDTESQIKTVQKIITLAESE